MNTLRALTLSLITAGCMARPGPGPARRGRQAAAAGLRTAEGRQGQGSAGQGARSRSRGQQDRRRAADHRPHEGRRRPARRRHGHGHPGAGILCGKVGGGEQGQIAEQLASAYAQQRNNAKANEWVGRPSPRATTAPRSSSCRPTCRAPAATTPPSPRTPQPRCRPPSRPAAPRRRRPAAPGRCAAAHRQQRRLQQHAREAADLTTRRRTTGTPTWPPAAQARLRRPLRAGRDAPAPGQRHLSKTEDFMEMAQLALQAGLPAEGKAHRRQGLQARALGTGAEAERHKRLKDLADKQEAEARPPSPARPPRPPRRRTATTWCKIGYAYVTLGEADKGIALIEQGHRQGRPEAPRGRQAAPGHGPAAVGEEQGQGHADAAQREGHRRHGRWRLWALYNAGRPVGGRLGHNPRAGLPPCLLAHWLQDLGGHGVHAIDTGFHRDCSTPPTCWCERRTRRLHRHRHQLRGAAPAGALDAWAWRRDAVDWVIPTHVHLDHAGGVPAC
jgi:hypothetical protein